MDYVKKINNNIEVRIKNEGMELPEKADTPMSLYYKPDLDVTAELETY